MMNLEFSILFESGLLQLYQHIHSSNMNILNDRLSFPGREQPSTSQAVAGPACYVFILTRGRITEACTWGSRDPLASALGESHDEDISVPRLYSPPSIFQ